jgi:hypothetical protein
VMKLMSVNRTNRRVSTSPRGAGSTLDGLYISRCLVS